MAPVSGAALIASVASAFAAIPWSTTKIASAEPGAEGRQAPVPEPNGESPWRRLGLLAEHTVRFGPRLGGGNAHAFGVELGALYFLGEDRRFALGGGVGYSGYGTHKNGLTSRSYEWVRLSARVHHVLGPRTGADLFAGLGVDGQLRSISVGGGYRWTVVRADLEFLVARDIVALDPDDQLAPDETNTSVQAGGTILFDEGWYSLVAVGVEAVALGVLLVSTAGE